MSRLFCENLQNYSLKKLYDSQHFYIPDCMLSLISNFQVRQMFMKYLRTNEKV